MKKILKQVVGIDVAQDELVVCLGRMYDDLVRATAFERSNNMWRMKRIHRLINDAFAELNSNVIKVRIILEISFSGKQYAKLISHRDIRSIAQKK